MIQRQPQVTSHIRQRRWVNPPARSRQLHRATKAYSWILHPIVSATRTEDVSVKGRVVRSKPSVPASSRDEKAISRISHDKIAHGRNSDHNTVMAKATKMKVSEDIVPIGEFKTHASKLLRRMHDSGRPMVITQNGRPAAVVLTPEDFDELGYREFVKAKVQAGSDSAKHKTHSADDVREHFRAKARAR